MFDSDDDNADGEKGEKEKVDEEADEEGVKLFLERAVQQDPVPEWCVLLQQMDYFAPSNFPYTVRRKY